MRGSCSGSLRLAVAILALLGIGGCGGHKPAGASPFAAKITLNPGGNISVQVGNSFGFSASATNSANGAVNASFTYTSSDTSIVNVAPNGAACAGHWDAAFTSCTPGNSGMAQVVATAVGTSTSSAPTFVFVHPPIDNILVKGVLTNNLPIQEPCLSQGQTMTVQAYAYSQGNDISATVGPFTWSANNANVVKITPTVTPVLINNVTYYIATNQATVEAVNPGITQIFANASSVTSTTFQQPDELSPSFLFDFFETCPIQTITLGLGPAGSQNSGQTNFSTTKGTAQNATAFVTDVMGNSSLPNQINQIILSKIPLTWTATQPGVMAVGSGCIALTCAISVPSPGSGTVTASCSPPTCNIGFPEVPPAFASASSLAACATAVRSLFPQVNSCEQFIPKPVYSTVPITGLISGTTTAATVLASSIDCQSSPPQDCSTGIYSLSTSKGSPGSANFMPTVPNSLVFDLVGDKAYMGSEFGAQTLNAANLNTNNAAFTSLGPVWGKVLAVAANGSSAIFSDAVHVPNQVYVAGTGAPVVLNISNATAAAFSPDGLKAFIFGRDTNQNPTLFVYSTLQALQQIQLPASTNVSSIAFSNNGAFAYVAESNLGGVGPAVSVYNTCDNNLATDPAAIQQIIPLPAAPIVFKALQDGIHYVALEESGDIDYITATVTGITPATLPKPASSICPMAVSNKLSEISLQQGTIHPINIFESADGSQLYVVATDRASILVYNFDTGAVTGILLAGNATPLSADMTVDSSTILVGGSDGQMHQISTANGGGDLVQIQFPFLPNYLNPFCTFVPSAGPCTFDLMVVKP
jgi:hypothetical protein